MSVQPISPINPTDDDARALARSLLAGASHAALGVIEPGRGMPMVSRVGLGVTVDGTPFTLISELSHHTKALRVQPLLSLLVGEPGDKGDPLSHPRLTVQAHARFVVRGTAEHTALRARYLATSLKAQLYIDFADFSFVVCEIIEAHLNGGFGKAYTLTAEDLRP